jgi:hypothetical protein
MQVNSLIIRGRQGGTGIPDTLFRGEDMPGKSFRERNVRVIDRASLA